MTGHVYVDESKRRDFVLVSAVVVPRSLSEARRAIRGLYLPGQNSIHMVKEKSSRQRQILSRIAQIDVAVALYVVPKGTFKTEVVARRRCLEELVLDMSATGCTDLVIERDDTLAAADRRVIRAQLERTGQLDAIRYSHAKVQSEPLLVIPDAIAWAWPQKAMKSQCEPVVTTVKTLTD